jgi:hypothetical protein
LVTAIDAFISANPTLLRRSETARPPSVMGDLPLAWVDSRNETAAYDSGLRARTMSPQVVVVSPLADNAETVARHDVLVDKLYDHFNAYAHIATNTSWDRLTVADEDFSVESETGTRHFYATRFTFENVLILEGRP